MSDWALGESEVFGSRYKRCEKKHKEETKAMLNNLHTYLNTLNSGVNPAQINAGFIHSEQKGVIALDQNGAEGKPTQTRLYIYPDEETRTVFTIAIGKKGNKKAQNKDVQLCCEFVEHLKKEKK